MAAVARKSRPFRNPRLAKIHIARKELGLDDGTYRAILLRLTGETSSADCTDAQLERVLDEFKAKGWKPTVIAGSAVRAPAPADRRPRRADHPAAGKARALWISLHRLGVIRDPGEAALESFARRQLGVERLQWADQGLVYKLIEALKAMAERAGWSQDLAGIPASRQVDVLKARLEALIAARSGDA